MGRFIALKTVIHDLYMYVYVFMCKIVLFNSFFILKILYINFYSYILFRFIGT